MIQKLLMAGLMLALAGCASSLRYSSIVTGAPDEARAKEVATGRVALKDRVIVVTHVSWDEARGAGPHAIRWNWYEGETLIAERAKTLDFTMTPYRFTRSLPASDLGIGRYRVEVLVDGSRVDEQTFDIVAN